MSSGNWKLEKEGKGVTAYTREVAGSNFREFKVEASVETTVDALIAMQRDVKNHPKWIDSVKTAELIKEDADNYYTHTVANAPWPVKNRDSAVRNCISRNEDNSATIEFYSDNDLAPTKKGCERVGAVKGSWQFNPADNGKVDIIYSAHIDPGGNIPAMISNKFSIDVPFNTIQSLVGLVKKYS
ncbi:hypothetical protein A9Q81_14175 [Gammaproteobacteria bacterium 42_54_T18]|nr:hypothetical protein A9Q81_14175 [Gammaproteobacteria bacterium 42_54_T18]